MKKRTVDSILKRISNSRSARRRVRADVDSGRWRNAEADPTRAAAFEARLERRTGPEEAIWGENDFQPAAFLTEGSTVRRAVARVLVQSDSATKSGSGFLVSSELFLTNQHVLDDADAAQSAIVIFDDELDENGRPKAQSKYRLAPERFFEASPENQLDFALVALGDRIEGNASVEELGFCALSSAPDRHRIGMPVNIIQHPNALPKIIAIRNNLLVHRDETHLQYETDTETGSSGAPVFNDQWEVVALHHYGAPSTPAKGSGTRNVNEGIRISAIYDHLRSRLPELKSEPLRQELLRRAFSAWTLPPVTTRQLERRPAAPAPRLLKSGAEALRLDTHYENRNGFNGDHVPGITVDLRRITSRVQDLIAPLHEKSAGTAVGELRYENFSVILNKARRFALLTATNIDGESYVKIDRKTGKRAEPPAEGETWYSDSRVSASYVVVQDFYTEWSHLFDRGHLTRREDPNWGDNAERANRDTFHFTNCTPQHWKFNQSKSFWQGIERYVLEKGILATSRKNPLTVLQGPVFDENDEWADEVQVPSAFWKIVVWKGKGGLKAVALLANQTKLLNIVRGSEPLSDGDSDVQHFQISIATVEKRTGLDLASIRKYDTFGSTLPRPGEVGSLITKFQDIKLV